MTLKGILFCHVRPLAYGNSLQLINRKRAGQIAALALLLVYTNDTIIISQNTVCT